MATKKLASAPLARRSNTDGARPKSGLLTALGSGGEGLRVRVDDIAPNPENPAHRAEDVEDLTASVRELGVLVAVTLAPAETYLAARPEFAEQIGSRRYVMLAGDRRLAASKAAQLEDVPAVIREDLAGRSSEARIAENVIRMELSPLEEARDFQRILDERDWSQRELSRRTGVSQAHVSKRLALLDLPEVIAEAVSGGSVQITEALELLKQKPEVVARVVADWDSYDDDWSLYYRAREARAALEDEHQAETAKGHASKLGAEYVADVFEVLGGSRSMQDRHRVTDRKTIRTLAKAGDLIVAPSYDGPRYFQKSRPVSPEVSTAAQQQREEDRAWKAAKAARRAFTQDYVTQRPSAADLTKVLTGMTLAGESMGSEITRLARQWCQAVGVGPEETEDWVWRRALADVSSPSVSGHIAWIIAHAVAEGGFSQTYISRWDRRMRGQMDRLTAAGYAMSGPEQAKYDAGVAHDAQEDER